MPRSIRSDKARRAPRVKFAGTVLALLRLDNGREIHARLHQLSFTGGLLHLEKPLDEGVKVEVLFHVGDSSIRSKAVILFPMWATQGYLQPFEFANLEEEDRRKLESDLQKFLSSTTNSSHSSERSAAAGSE
jgi:PilZ domain